MFEHLVLDLLCIQVLCSKSTHQKVGGGVAELLGEWEKLGSPILPFGLILLEIPSLLLLARERGLPLFNPQQLNCGLLWVDLPGLIAGDELQSPSSRCALGGVLERGGKMN